MDENFQGKKFQKNFWIQEKKEKRLKDKIERDPNYQPGFEIGKTFEDDEDFRDYNNRAGRKSYK